MHPITRRTASMLLAAATAAAAMPAAAQKKKKKKKTERPVGPPPDPALMRRLQSDLDARTTTGTDMRVVHARAGKGIGVIEMTAVVEMHWHPGMRRRPVEGVGADADEAYAALLEATVTPFKTVNPDGFS